MATVGEFLGSEKLSPFVCSGEYYSTSRICMNLWETCVHFSGVSQHRSIHVMNITPSSCGTNKIYWQKYQKLTTFEKIQLGVASVITDIKYYDEILQHSALHTVNQQQCGSTIHDTETCSIIEGICTIAVNFTSFSVQS